MGEKLGLKFITSLKMAMTMHPALLNQRGKAGGVHVFE